ncbi:hypothetical protein AC579_8841 [Pseudocercospora musae]|nr:hypothetical protein AC579_8841 [Pseudocercospora musae]
MEANNVKVQKKFTHVSSEGSHSTASLRTGASASRPGRFTKMSDLRNIVSRPNPDSQCHDSVESQWVLTPQPMTKVRFRPTASDTLREAFTDGLDLLSHVESSSPITQVKPQI